MARAQSCANHVQHIERLSRASVMLRANLVRRDSSAIKFDRVEIAFIWALVYGWTIKPISASWVRACLLNLRCRASFAILSCKHLWNAHLSVFVTTRCSLWDAHSRHYYHSGTVPHIHCSLLDIQFNYYLSFPIFLLRHQTFIQTKYACSCVFMVKTHSMRTAALYVTTLHDRAHKTRGSSCLPTSYV